MSSLPTFEIAPSRDINKDDIVKSSGIREISLNMETLADSRLQKDATRHKHFRQMDAHCAGQQHMAIWLFDQIEQ
jgi:hypothetical protein